MFVGSYGYPRVRVGPMIPPFHGDTMLMDAPELWAGRTIEEIVGFRLSMVRGVTTLAVTETSNRFMDQMHEFAMSKAPIESEAVFEKQPVSDPDLKEEIRLNSEVAPFGPAAPLKQFKLTTSSADQRIESAYSDTDLRAADAIFSLYKNGVEPNRIQRILSVGMLGEKKRRRLVPTRWSISATDDTISRQLIREIESNPSVDQFEVTMYSHVENQYSVILIPSDIWSFEMIECWYDRNGHLAVGSDHEDARGLDHYPSIAGAYFAARLAVAEHLSQRRRKAVALVIREIHPQYVMPLGVWQIREGVRAALKMKRGTPEGMVPAIILACSQLSISASEIASRSWLAGSNQAQKRITDFA